MNSDRHELLYASVQVERETGKREKVKRPGENASVHDDVTAL